MDEVLINQLRLKLENIYDELNVVETLVKVTKENCKQKELTANYYGSNLLNSRYLSEERNDYINLLSVVSDKLISITKEYDLIEFELLNYSSIPTIAAER